MLRIWPVLTAALLLMTSTPAWSQLIRTQQTKKVEAVHTVRYSYEKVVTGQACALRHGTKGDSAEAQ